ncbi:ADP-ribosylglycohydrolase family protein [Sphingomonas sp. HDW15A]|uniref:ADP-ribosylglycohydrolase family protein n=1 Tax=Sphingomonas sp. HDW15A TaxID=2714942 RepID=UPI001F0E406A|nr:ADP-ribosylglycohydrolase family protein [Sphingomonas sp. HDW15A]
MARTSLTHPLEIAAIQAGEGLGRIGLTFCPGKVQPNAVSGSWERDLNVDLDAVEAWGAAAVVTLIEPGEMAALKVEALGEQVANRHMTWFHLPIPDVGIPGAQFESSWAAAGEALRALIRSGFDVVVHCKGGLGRAGMIGGRLLVELGWDPTMAIQAVRRVRPGAIETEAQRQHVLNTASIDEPFRDASKDAVEDRALGCLLGLAVGDAVGTTLEFTARDSNPRLKDLVGGGPFGLDAGEWTDDTSMALALADSLLKSERLDEVDLMQRFVRWWRDGDYSCRGTCFDIGITTRQALSKFETTGEPIAGSTDPQSAGNGSLMRLAPVVLHGLAIGELGGTTAAVQQSRTTHGAQTCIDACDGFAFRLYLAVTGKMRSYVFDFKGHGAIDPAIGTIFEGSWRGKRRSVIKSSGYVAHSLEAAMWCVARTSNFRDAVLLAANLGDDADTTAAITGQLAGALYGSSAIPSEWLERLAWREKIQDVGWHLISRPGSGPRLHPT